MENFENLDLGSSLSYGINQNITTQNWTICEEEDNLVFKYKGETKVTITPNGVLRVVNDVVVYSETKDFREEDLYSF